MFEPDIKTVGRDWARVLAASLLSSAASRGLRAAKPKAVSESPIPLPLTNGCTSPPATFNPHHPIKQFMLSHHPVPHLPHKGFWPQYLYHRAEGKDVDKKFCFICVSTHILTRRMTAILNKNTLSKTARIIPFEYNTLKIYIFSNSYLLFFWKNTPFSGANLPEDFCALIIRTKISKYP